MDQNANGDHAESNRRAYGTDWAPATPIPRLSDDWHLVPTSARLYNWLTDGADHYPADRQVFQGLSADDINQAKAAASINMDHNARIAGTLAQHGVDQVLDLGCGLPQMPRRTIWPDVHAAVLRVQPDATMIYVDIDPVVIAHRRIATAHTGVAFVQGDLRDMATLLASEEISGRLDLTRPVAALVHDVLPWIADPQATDAMRVLRDWAPAGSRLSITHATDMPPTMPSTLTPLVRDAADRNPGADITYRPRSRDTIATYFGNWALLDPGVVPTHKWHRSHSHRALPSHFAGAYAGVAVKGVDSP
ncbi:MULTISPECIES: SAM-dependent methyltransferase [unclassified Streptomyces]|uniref:SAM-dependent methyltransferase n=1 Tax=unclassified Streptomyces TaxID=2593676 RepID=UPI0036E03A39